MDPTFIDSGVKVNGACYREVLLTSKLLPVMLESCGEFFIFQQGNVPAYLLERETPTSFHQTFIHLTAQISSH